MLGAARPACERGGEGRGRDSRVRVGRGDLILVVHSIEVGGVSARSGRPSSMSARLSHAEGAQHGVHRLTEGNPNRGGDQESADRSRRWSPSKLWKTGRLFKGAQGQQSAELNSDASLRSFPASVGTWQGSQRVREVARRSRRTVSHRLVHAELVDDALLLSVATGAEADVEEA